MTTLVLALTLAKWAAQLWLEKLNQSHVLAHAGAVPDALKDTIEPHTYAKSVEYTLAKSRFAQMENAWNTVVLHGLALTLRAAGQKSRDDHDAVLRPE